MLLCVDKANPVNKQTAHTIETLHEGYNVINSILFFVDFFYEKNPL